MKKRMHISHLVFTISLMLSMIWAQFGISQNTGSVLIERVILQTDRNIYLPGEKIWFRADYFVDEHKSTKSFSKVLYVELLNASNEQIHRNKYAIENGMVAGAFVLPEGMATANYILRAYTQYMRNFDPEMYCHNIITVINPTIPLAAIDTLGQWEIEAALAKFKNDTLLALKFKPQIISKIKSAYITTIDSVDTAKLVIYPNGLASAEIGNFRNREVFLICEMDPIEKVSKKVSVSWSKIKKVDGVEIGVKPQDIKIANLEKVYKPREFVEIGLEGDAFKRDLHYTVAVVKKKTSLAPEFLPVYIVDNPLLLGHYLQSVPHSISIEKQVALIKSLNSNEAFQPKKININTNDQWIAETRAINLKGVVRDVKTNEGVSNVEVMLSVLGEHPIFHIYTSNDEGVFWFNLKHTEGITNLYLSLKNKTERELEIMVNSDFSNDYANFTLSQPLIDTSMKSFIEGLYVSMQVNQSFPKADSLEPKKGHAIRFGETDASIRLEDFVEMKTLESVFDELVPFIKVRKQNGIPKLDVLDDKTYLVNDDPLILVDDLTVSDVSELLKIHPSRVEQIEVINSTYVYGDHVFKGIVMVTTNTDNFGGIQLPASFTALEFQSVSPVLVTEPQKYESLQQKQSRHPDFRTVLFWEPDYQPDKMNGHLSFYTSDQLGEYEVVVRGFSENRMISFGKASFTVGHQ